MKLYAIVYGHEAELCEERLYWTEAAAERALDRRVEDYADARRYERVIALEVETVVATTNSADPDEFIWDLSQ